MSGAAIRWGNSHRWGRVGTAWGRLILGVAAAGWWLASGVDLALGYVAEVNSAGQVRRWALSPPDTRVSVNAVNRATRAIRYRFDVAGSPAWNDEAARMAMRAAFDQWQAVPGTLLRFEEAPTTSGTLDVDLNDGFNTVFWSPGLFVNGGRDNLSGVLALTYVASYPDGNVIANADIVFNGIQFDWFTDFENPTRQDVFVEAIALHEIGHLLGLRHSPVGGATMLAVGDRGVNSQTGLSADEIAAARALYGAAASAPTQGRIVGTVTASGSPVFGAAVFVEDGSGNVVAGTVTRAGGQYELGGLAAGPHSVRVAPLDPAGGANVLVRGADIAGTYSGAHTGFHPSADRDVTVPGGGVVTADFEVEAGQPIRIVRMLRPSGDLEEPSFHDKPVAVQPGGQTVYLGVLTSAALAGAVRVDIRGDGLLIAGPTETRANVLGNLSLAAVPVTVLSGATPGLRSIRLEAGGLMAWAHGFIELAPPFPDVNFDGLDDRFQRRFWPRFTGPEAGPTADPDGDGFSNRWEYETGSDPTDAMSAHFRIESVRVTESGARVRSQAAAGKRFQLYTRETVAGSEWQAVGGPVLAAGPEAEFSDPGATGSVRFYRVRMVP